jgi:hypothetical protein
MHLMHAPEAEEKLQCGFSLHFKQIKSIWHPNQQD